MSIFEPSRGDAKRLKKRRFDTSAVKLMVMMVFLELTCGFFVYFRGYGFVYFRMLLAILPISCLAFYAAYSFGANILVYVWTVIILNFGFLIQCLSGGGEVFNSRALTKITIAFGIAAAAALVYTYMAYLLRLDMALILLIGVQLLLTFLLAVKGNIAGSMDYQGARLDISLGPFSIQPLEIIKLIYIFVMAALLCKSEFSDKKIFRLPRELAAILYSAFTLASMVYFSELGTLIIIAGAGSLMMYIFAGDRRWVRVMVICEIAAAILIFIAVAGLHDHIRILNKIYLRVIYAYHPERDPVAAGYQGIMLREAIAVGGYFGPETRRYCIVIPVQESDLIFAKSVQVCGIIPASLMIIGYICLIKAGNDVALHCKDTYYRGIGMGLSILLGVQCIYNIGCNLGVLPISGITLYLQSSGFTSLTMGLVMSAVMLVISTGAQERKRIYYERRMEEDLLARYGFRRKRRRSSVD